LQRRPSVGARIVIFISQDAEAEAVEGSLFPTETTKWSILLIRGLIACEVLQSTLGQKRWQIQYRLG
jgi:hypothetical protein